MENSDLYSKLENWIKTIKNAFVGLKITELALVVLIGVASNKTVQLWDPWFIILIISAIFWIIIGLFQLQYERNYPASIVEELKAKQQVGAFQKSFGRQRALNEFINSSIRALNDQTCSTGLPDSAYLCDEDLQIRLTDIYKPIIQNPNTVLNAYDLSEFTIGLYLNQYYSEGLFDKNGPIADSGIIFLRDDNGLENNSLFKDLLINTNYTHASLELKSEIEKSLVNVEFRHKRLTIGSDKYTMICSDMPLFCSDEEASGVLFIILKGKYKPTEDLPYILRIFNRLGANYVYKYNECVLGKIEGLLNTQPPPPLRPKDIKTDLQSN